MDNEKTLYKVKNISQNDAVMLGQLINNNIESVSKAISSLKSLLKNLNIYKDCLIDSINLESENLDIAIKYSSNEKNYYSSGSLPGVISTPKEYDIAAIKADSDRMNNINTNKDKVSSQKELYLSICKENVKFFIESWKSINLNNAYWNEYLESFNKSINNNY